MPLRGVGEAGGLSYLDRMSRPLEPDRPDREELTQQINALLQDWFDQAPTMSASGEELAADLAARLMLPPSEEGQDLGNLLDLVQEAGRSGIYHPSGGHMSYIPNAGLFSSAAAEFLAAGLNRYTGVSGAAPGMSAIEHGVIRWMASLFDLGDRASGLLLAGTSLANFTAVVAARTARLGEDFGDGVIYVTSHTHHSFEKSARLAGFRQSQIRAVGVDDGLRMSMPSLETAIADDTASGLRPLLVVGSAGTTDTGAVDPLEAMGQIAAREQIWFHVDAAYGGFFQLTERGAAVLRGIETADSIAIDPHKGLSMPFGLGALLVRDESYLIDANQGRGAYLRQEDHYDGIRDISALGPELTRPFRALQMWLPLHLHGVAPFRDALDESLDLARYAYQRVSEIEGIDAAWEPDLSIVAFRFDDDAAGRRALEAVNADHRVHLSPTVVDDRFVLRLAILNRRTTSEHIDHAIEIIEKTLIG
jgi:aromatic-L-amino-acid/L-tryptophan decarboxylase